MVRKPLCVFLLSAILITGCTTAAPTPVVIIVTTERQVPVTIEVPVTRLSEVTRQIEVTCEVPITIEVTQEVTVTRLVEVVVTATPTITPTEEFRPTSTPRPPAALPLADRLLRDMKALRRNIELLANDQPGIIMCSRNQEMSIANNYEAVINYPPHDVSSASAVARDAHNRYRRAIDTIRATNKDLYQFCVDWLAGVNTSDRIPFQIWGPARQGVNTALSILIPGIEELENR